MRDSLLFLCSKIDARNMEKIPFTIVCEVKDKTAFFRIIGEIGWETDSSGFREEVDKAVSEGATQAHLYLHGPGGSCTEAAEIVNIMSVFKKITGEGGALVASAYTYIAAHCETFEMPANGLFMVHKPSGGTWGTSDNLQSYLKVLQDTETEYYNTLKAKATSPEEFDKQWNKGDWWMTASEAKENGFVTSVKEKLKIDKQTVAMISACGCPNTKIPNSNENKIDMDEVKKILKLSASATEKDIVDAISPLLALSNKVADLTTERDGFKARIEAIELAEKEANSKEAKDLIAVALKDGRLTEDKEGSVEKFWLSSFEGNHEGSKKMLAALPKRKNVIETLSGGEPKESAWEKRQREISEANKGK